MSGLTRKQKRDYAKKLYLTEPGITQKEIAQRTGVTEKTISGWVNENDKEWDRLRVSLLTSKEEQLSSLYRQLDALKTDIERREKKWPTTPEGDIISKLTSSIRNLETETSIADKMETGKEFLRFVRKVTGIELSNQIAGLFDGYIKSVL